MSEIVDEAQAQALQDYKDSDPSGLSAQDLMDISKAFKLPPSKVHSIVNGMSEQRSKVIKESESEDPEPEPASLTASGGDITYNIACAIKYIEGAQLAVDSLSGDSDPVVRDLVRMFETQKQRVKDLLATGTDPDLIKDVSLALGTIKLAAADESFGIRSLISNTAHAIKCIDQCSTS